MFGVTLRTDDLAKRMASKNEVRLTDVQINQVQQIELSIAEDVINCCEKNNIKYTLSGGTCLGAIRHQGFIPWDDDIDINISRDGYTTLIEELEKDYGGKYWIVSPGGNIPTGFASTSIKKRGTTLRTIADVDARYSGVSIDIFIIENAANNFLLRKMHGLLCMTMGLLLSCRRYYEIREELLTSLEEKSAAKRSLTFKVAIGKLVSFGKLNSWVRWTNKVYSLCKNENSKFVVIPTGRRHFFKETYERSMFFPAKNCEFNGRTWKIPGDVDTYMKALYGANYMTPPPPEDRERHIVYEIDLGNFNEGKEGDK